MMEWISVKDRMPDDYQYCLVYAKREGTDERCPISIGRYEIDEWALLFEGENNACAGGDLTWEMDADEITHWMSLPEPPKCT